MNERIEKMMLEATKDIPQGYYVPPQYFEKFAELIVRECAELFVDQRYMILNPHEPFANERVRALKEHDKDTVKKIKRHFGVEE